MKKSMIIAIDGPVGSGKGTLAVKLAKRLNAVYIYTGGMYRALALACLRESLDLHNEEKVLDLLGRISIELRLEELGTRVFLNGEEVSDEIFKPEISRVTPIIAALPTVRKEMVSRQKKMIEEKSVVIEGRDIATDVAPDADLKIYLTADINMRAKRRFEQLKKRRIEILFEEVLYEVQERDRKDRERQASPLIITPDAYVLDTTNLTIKETVEKVIEKLKEKGVA
ncbi:MAG: (d)CMP kinase [bacterium]|nr:(d)CMP kinase [bacterium]